MHVDSKSKQQPSPETMACIRRNTTQTSKKIWRPWDDATTNSDSQKYKRIHPYTGCSRRNHIHSSSHPLQSYISTFKHPVRLYWTKAAYDYMYEAGERLLRNFPVQATIQVIDESDSSDDDDDDDTYDDNDDRNKGIDSKDLCQDDETNRRVQDKNV